jgi:hypothetical protein
MPQHNHAEEIFHAHSFQRDCGHSHCWIYKPVTFLLWHILKQCLFQTDLKSTQLEVKAENAISCMTLGTLTHVSKHTVNRIYACTENNAGQSYHILWILILCFIFNKTQKYLIFGKVSNGSLCTVQWTITYLLSWNMVAFQQSYYHWALLCKLSIPQNGRKTWCIHLLWFVQNMVATINQLISLQLAHNILPHLMTQ